MFGLVVLCLFVPLKVIGASTFHIAEFAGVETNRLVELEGVGTGNVKTSTGAVMGRHSPWILVDELDLTRSLTSRSARQSIRCPFRRSHMTGRLDTSLDFMIGSETGQQSKVSSKKKLGSPLVCHGDGHTAGGAVQGVRWASRAWKRNTVDLDEGR
jgi:hypothetical protein